MALRGGLSLFSGLIGEIVNSVKEILHLSGKSQGIVIAAWTNSKRSSYRGVR